MSVTPNEFSKAVRAQSEGDPVLGPLVERARRELLKYVVGRMIQCPLTGQVLDYRTCVVFVDSDGDPVYAVSQDGFRKVAEHPDRLEMLADRHGYRVDWNTVKGIDTAGSASRQHYIETGVYLWPDQIETIHNDSQEG